MGEIIPKWFIFRAKLQFLYLILNKTKIIQPGINFNIIKDMWVSIHTKERVGGYPIFFLFLKILKVPMQNYSQIYRNKNTCVVFYGNMKNWLKWPKYLIFINSRNVVFFFFFYWKVRICDIPILIKLPATVKWIAYRFSPFSPRFKQSTLPFPSHIKWPIRRYYLVILVQKRRKHLFF